MRNPIEHLIQGEACSTGEGDAQVQWMRFGTGSRPLVLLHGGHGNWKHWVRNVNALSFRSEIWVPDMPGFGASAGAPPVGDAQQRLAWVEDRVVESLSQLPFGSKPFDLAGFSFGGLIAAGIASRLDVRRLALLGPAGHGTPRQHEFEFKDWQTINDRGQAREALRHNLSVLMLGGLEPNDLAMEIHEEGCRGCRVSTRAISRMALLPARMQKLRNPVLVLWGESDATGIPSVVAEALGLGGPERPLSVVQDAAHWVQFQQPGKVNRILDDWFNN